MAFGFFKPPKPSDLGSFTQFAKKPPPTPAEPAGIVPHVDWNAVADSYLYNTGNVGWTKRKQGIFHPSTGLHPSINNCRRQIMLDLMCADRSPQSIPASVHRRLENGTDRHVGIQRMFSGMAETGHMGITYYQPEVHAVHGVIEGHADGLIVFNNGHKYLHDYKTKATKQMAKLYANEPQHVIQLNTYLGALDVRTGYIIYEDKDSQAWATPLDKFRVDFNPDTWRETIAFCNDVLKEMKSGKLPEFDEPVCKSNLMFCAYQSACTKERQKLATFAQLDKRNPEQKRKHLAVIP